MANKSSSGPILLVAAVLSIIGIIFYFSSSEPTPGIEKSGLNLSASQISEGAALIGRSAVPLSLATLSNQADFFLYFAPAKLKPLLTDVIEFRNKLLGSSFGKGVESVAEQATNELDDLNQASAELSFEDFEKFVSNDLNKLGPLSLAFSLPKNSSGKNLGGLNISAKVSVNDSNLLGELEKNMIAELPLKESKDGSTLKVEADAENPKAFNISLSIATSEVTKDKPIISTNGSIQFQENAIEFNLGPNRLFQEQTEKHQLLTKFNTDSFSSAIIKEPLSIYWFKLNSFLEGIENLILMSTVESDSSENVLSAEELAVVKNQIEQALSNPLYQSMESSLVSVDIEKTRSGGNVLVSKGCSKLTTDGEFYKIFQEVRKKYESKEAKSALAKLINKNSVIGFNLSGEQLALQTKLMPLAYSEEVRKEVLDTADLKDVIAGFETLGEVFSGGSITDLVFELSATPGALYPRPRFVISHEIGKGQEILTGLNQALKTFGGEQRGLVTEELANGGYKYSITIPPQIVIYAQSVTESELLISLEESDIKEVKLALDKESNTYFDNATFYDQPFSQATLGRDYNFYISTFSAIDVLVSNFSFMIQGKPEELEELFGFEYFSKQNSTPSQSSTLCVDTYGALLERAS